MSTGGGYVLFWLCELSQLSLGIISLWQYMLQLVCFLAYCGCYCCCWIFRGRRTVIRTDEHCIESTDGRLTTRTKKRERLYLNAHQLQTSKCSIYDVLIGRCSVQHAQTEADGSSKTQTACNGSCPHLQNLLFRLQLV